MRNFDDVRCGGLGIPARGEVFSFSGKEWRVGLIGLLDFGYNEGAEDGLPPPCSGN